MLFFHKQSYLKIRKLLQPSLIFKILYQFKKKKIMCIECSSSMSLRACQIIIIIIVESYEYIYISKRVKITTWLTLP